MARILLLSQSFCVQITPLFYFKRNNLFLQFDKFLIFRLLIFCVVNFRLPRADSLLSHLMKITHDFWDSSIKRREHTTLWEAGTFSLVILVDVYSVKLLTASDLHLYRYETVLSLFAAFKWQMLPLCSALVNFFSGLVVPNAAGYVLIGHHVLQK